MSDKGFTKCDEGRGMREGKAVKCRIVRYLYGYGHALKVMVAVTYGDRKFCRTTRIYES